MAIWSCAHRPARCFGLALSALGIGACGEREIETFAQTSGPVSHWRFDEGKGTSAADAGPGANTGVLHGSPTWESSGFSLAKFPNTSSLRLDGDDDLVEAGVHGLPVVGEPMSISVWLVHGAQLRPQGVLVTLMDAAKMIAVHVGFRSSVLSVWTFGNLKLLANTPPPASAGWYHVAYTYDGKIHRLYVNGALRGSSSQPVDKAVVTQALIGGFRSPGFADELFEGLIDDVRIYDHGLTDAEVVALAGGEDSP